MCDNFESVSGLNEEDDDSQSLPEIHDAEVLYCLILAFFFFFSVFVSFYGVLLLNLITLLYFQRL